MNSYAALILAGGRSRRMAGLGTQDKTRLEVGGRVGPTPPATAAHNATRTNLTWTREDPAGGGPVAALEAGLAHLTAPRVVVLAADLPFVTRDVVETLVTASTGHAGAVAVDDDRRDQPLLAVYDSDALRSALPTVTSGARLRAVLERLDDAGPVVRVSLPGHPPVWWDCDSPEALRQAKMWL
jgi:molybdopterin-guanine dinucleotide biosynthesis protein A